MTTRIIFFFFSIKKFDYCYSFELQMLQNNRPIRASVGLISTDIGLE
jgi:hypothetical protein